MIRSMIRFAQTHLFCRTIAIAALLIPAALAQPSVPVHDVENPGHSPLRLAFTLKFSGGDTSDSEYFFGVPSGQRMVVEYVTASCPIPSAAGVGVATLTLALSDKLGAVHNYPLPVSMSASYGGIITPVRYTRYFTSQLVNLYVDGSSIDAPVGAIVVLTGPSPESGITCDFEISGHTVNTP